MDNILEIKYCKNFKITNFESSIFVSSGYKSLFYFKSSSVNYLICKSKISFVLPEDILFYNPIKFNGLICSLVATKKNLYLLNIESCNDDIEYVKEDNTLLKLPATCLTILYVNNYFYCLSAFNIHSFCLKYKINFINNGYEIMGWKIKFPDNTFKECICKNRLKLLLPNSNVLSSSAIENKLLLSDNLYNQLFLVENNFSNSKVLLYMGDNGIVYYLVENTESAVSNNLNILCSIDELIVDIFYFSLEDVIKKEFLIIVGINGYLLFINGKEIFNKNINGPVECCCLQGSLFIYSDLCKLYFLDIKYYFSDEPTLSSNLLFVKSLCNVKSINLINPNDDTINLVSLLTDGRLISYSVYLIHLDRNSAKPETEDIETSTFDLLKIDDFEANLTQFEEENMNYKSVLQQLQICSCLRADSFDSLNSNNYLAPIIFSVWNLPDDLYKIKFILKHSAEFDSNWRLTITLRSVYKKSAIFSTSKFYSNMSNECELIFNVPDNFAPPLNVAPVLTYSFEGQITKQGSSMRNENLTNLAYGDMMFNPIVIPLKNFYIGIGCFLKPASRNDFPDGSDDNLNRLTVKLNDAQINSGLKNSKEFIKNFLKSNLSLHPDLSYDKDVEVFLKISDNGITHVISFNYSEDRILSVVSSSFAFILNLYHHLFYFVKMNSIDCIIVLFPDEYNESVSKIMERLNEVKKLDSEKLQIKRLNQLLRECASFIP